MTAKSVENLPPLRRIQVVHQMILPRAMRQALDKIAAGQSDRSDRSRFEWRFRALGRILFWSQTSADIPAFSQRILDSRRLGNAQELHRAFGMAAHHCREGSVDMTELAFSPLEVARQVVWWWHDTMTAHPYESYTAEVRIGFDQARREAKKPGP